MLRFSWLSSLVFYLIFQQSFVLIVCEDEIDESDVPVIEGQGPDVIIPTEDEVLVLNTENFHRVVKTREFILVEFYAPWCGHCQALAPEYAKAAKLLKESGVQLAKVDASEEKLLAEEFGVKGFPTLKLFRKGEVIEEYDGARTAVALVEFMKQRTDPSFVPPPSNVLELTAKDFDEVVNVSPLMLVEFFAPWCGHCKKLAPEYEAAATILKKHGIPLAKVDATVEDELAKRFGVSGYPTLKVFRNGRPFEYKGGRDSSSIVQYMEEQQKLPSHEVRTAVNAKNAVSRTQPTVFACFSSDQSELFQEYVAAAHDLRGMLPLVHTFDVEVAKMFKVDKDSIAILQPEIYSSKFEKSVRPMKFKEDQIVQSSDIVSFVTSKSVPLLGERTPQNEMFLYSVRPLLVIYGNIDFSHQHVGATQHIRRKLLPLASKHSGKNGLVFALSNEDLYVHEMGSLGLDDSGEDVNAVIFTDKQKFVMEPDEDYDEAIEEFVEKFKSGKLKPFLKSQPVPTKQSGPVQVLVAKNFNKVVIDQKDRDFLIEFYAPWCGHCKKLEPVYKQLAKQLTSSHPHVVVAKFDATANDLPVNFEVQGFPTIYYVSRNSKQNPVKYEGENSLEKLKEFVDGQGSISATAKEEL